MIRRKDCCGCGDWKSQIRELWEKYQSVVKGIKAGSDTVYPDGDGIADIDGAIENEVARQIASESLVTDEELQAAVANLATVSALDTGLATIAAAKQDKLINQLNIKSLNGVSLLGSGNIVVTADSVAWDNVTDKPEFAEVATSGSYDDLTNKPTIPAAQVNSDWNADSGVAQILNRPSLAAVATSGSYDDLTNKPTIPAAQVNSDWNAASGVAQILNKPSLAAVATSGSYDDLTNKPTIPAAQVNSDWNAASGVAQILNKPTIPSGADLVPSTTGITDGYVLTNDNGTPAWKAGGGGGGGLTPHTYSTWGAFAADVIAHPDGIISNTRINSAYYSFNFSIASASQIRIVANFMETEAFGWAMISINTSETYAGNLTFSISGVRFDIANQTFRLSSPSTDLALANIVLLY